jgi:hypothetical protein
MIRGSPYPLGVPGDKGKPRQERRPDTARLYREVTYLHRDEEEGLVRYAEEERCSKAEVLRRALRKFLKVED